MPLSVLLVVATSTSKKNSLATMVFSHFFSHFFFHNVGTVVLDFVDYSFSENGLIAYRKGESLGSTVRPFFRPPFFLSFISFFFFSQSNNIWVKKTLDESSTGH